MSDRVIAPARNLSGALSPPGDKSISHRYGMLAALADGVSTLENFSSGADCASTLACMQALGVPVQRDGTTVRIEGVGLGGLRAPAATLDAGNSGSTMRMLAGILAAQPFASVMTGDASLSRRPMRRVLEPLGQMGARIEADEGHAPLRFEPPRGPLTAIEYTLPVASAQVKSAVLLAGLYAHGTTVVTEPQANRDHTEIALAEMGTGLSRRRGRIELHGPVARLEPAARLRIPSDASSAAFFLCAAAMFPDSDLLVDGVLLNPTRSVLLDVLRRMGAKLTVVSVESAGGELVGSLSAGSAEAGLRGTRIAGADAVALIDEAPILAVLATATDTGIEFADMSELRVKESDRIAAIAHNLRAMGATCEERPDGLRVPGGQQLHGARIASHGDHRIAMAFSIAALRATDASVIEDAECASISYPEFYETLARLAER